MDEVLRLKSLGGLHIALGEASDLAFISNKAQALLVYLALAGKPVPRTSLAGLLWSELPEDKARSNLRMVLTNLRKLVGPHVDITRQTVALNPEALHHLDVDAFLATVEPALKASTAAQQLQAAIDLYQGDFLEGLFVEDAPLFEEWALMQRERYRGLMIQALLQLSAYHTDRGEYAEGIKSTSRLLAMEPWREEAHRQLMLLLSRSGQRSAALAQYEKCQQILQKELDVEPMEATQTLYQRIKATASEPVHNLPPQPTPFVGRTEELAQLSAQLENPDCRLLTLLGVGGIGKTRLGLEAASRKLNRYLDGVYFVSLAPIASPDLIASSVAKVVNFQFSGQKTPNDQLLDYLKDKELLLVLDNFEHLLEGTTLLTAILNSAPEVTLLVTSRQRLELSWEWPFEVEGLAVPADAGDPIEAYSAVQLFLNTAQRIKGSTLKIKDYPHAANICRQLEGIPLGIELAGTWARTMSSQQIAEAIEQNLVSLKTSMKDVALRHRSLQAVFDHSWGLLSPAEQDLFKKLSVFRGGFTLKAAQAVAQAVAQALKEETDQVAQRLAGLVDQSLVKVNDQEEETRFYLLEPVRQYGEEKIENPAEQSALHQAHLDFFLALAQRAEPELQGKHEQDWLNCLEADHDNLRTSLAWAVDHDIEKSSQLIGALELFWHHHGHVIEGGQWAEKVLQKSKGQRNIQRAKVLLVAAGFADELGDYEHTKALAQEGLALTQQLEDPAGIAQSLYALGRVAWRQNDYERATSFANEGLTCFMELGDKRNIAKSLSLLGVVALRQSDFATARGYFEDSLVIARETENIYQISVIVSNLGNIANSQGHYATARTYHEEALEIAREFGNRYRESVCLGNLGMVIQNQGDFERAKTMTQETLALKREVGDKWGVAWALSNLGIIAIEQGNYEEATSLLNKSLVIDREQGERQREAIDLANLGNVAFLRGDLDMAKSYYERSKAIREEVGHRKGIGKSLNCLGHIAQLQGERATARTLYEASLAIHREIEDQSGIVLNLAGLAGIVRLEGEPKQAAQLLGKAQAAVQALGSVISSIDRPVYDQHQAALREALGSKGFENEFAKGQSMTLEQAFEIALEKTSHD